MVLLLSAHKKCRSRLSMIAVVLRGHSSVTFVAQCHKECDSPASATAVSNGNIDCCIPDRRHSLFHTVLSCEFC